MLFKIQYASFEAVNDLLRIALMEWMMIIKALLSLCFVLGLLLLTLWGLKYIQLYTQKSNLFKKLKDKQRISVEEMRRLDAKNSVVLIKKDEVEFLVLLGANQPLLLETSPIKKGDK